MPHPAPRRGGATGETTPIGEELVPRIVSMTSEELRPRVVGNMPPEDVQVRYQLFIRGEYAEDVGDSDWLEWSPEGYLFGEFEPGVCVVARYGWDGPDAVAWSVPRQLVIEED